MDVPCLHVEDTFEIMCLCYQSWGLTISAVMTARLPIPKETIIINLRFHPLVLRIPLKPLLEPFVSLNIEICG